MKKPHYVASILPSPVEAGNEIRVRSKFPAISVTDSAGNTYIQKSKRDWRAYHVRGGQVAVTVTSEKQGNEVKVQEYRPRQRKK